MEETRKERIRNESIGGTKHVRCFMDGAREARQSFCVVQETW